MFGSAGLAVEAAFFPCILRLNPFASFIFWGVASVVSKAFIRRVDKDFRLLKASSRSFTALL